jgi:Fe2+ transport system protein FeoA
MTRPLSELKVGDKGKVEGLTDEGSVHRRILDMGIIPGTELEVERIAPLGGPIWIRIKGYQLSLRKEEAAGVRVEIA